MSKWISIDDSLPKIGDRCLVVDGCKGSVMEAVRYQGKKFNRFGIECLPTHWMPLPEPPSND